MFFVYNLKMSMGGPPHHNQAKKSKYPKTRKLASPGENVQFFVLGGAL